MILLLVVSFILVNAISGYLNADPAIAFAATVRSDVVKTTKTSPAVRLARQVNHRDLQD
jgi:hypothetical protein